jgi:hypothetical protein
MCAVFALRPLVPVQRVVDDIVIVTECSNASDWEGPICFIPFR